MAERLATAVPRPAVTAAGAWPAGLLPALRRLDLLLERAVTAAQAIYGPQAAADPYRGLYISHADVEQSLARAPGEPLLYHQDGMAGGRLPDAAASGSSLAWLRDAFDLSPFAVDVLLIALAPELDLRYERLYAYLQDDVSRRRPSVDLALNLLCPSPEEKLRRRAELSAGAALVRHGLLHVVPDPAQPHLPLLAHVLKLDDQVVRLLLGDPNLDHRLASFCHLSEPPTGPVASPRDDIVAELAPLIAAARTARRPLRLYFHGPPGAGKRATAAALAAGAGARLLDADLARLLLAGADVDQLVRLVLREAWLQDAVLLIDGLDGLRAGERADLCQRLVLALAEDTGITILVGTQPWVPAPVPAGRVPLGITVVGFPTPDAGQRRACWQAGLAAAGIEVAPAGLDALADRFRLTPGQIADAIAGAANHAGRRAPRRAGRNGASARPRPDLDELFGAARAQTGHELAALAHRIEPSQSWDAIVLPDDAIAQLRELCGRVAQRRRVMDAWGFDRKLSLGKGANALFTGPSGTGKTMAAEIIGHELGLDLFRIDLAGVVSKYIGETEKNLDRIFTAAEHANAVLFFDEADALFGKRSEVRDSHDRYANIEIAYLLQQMEQYEGIAILATNLRGNLDESFTRRLSFTIHFPFPDDAARLRIWQGIWPAETPLAAGVDLDLLARRFRLSGGNIKNVALAAAFLAAEEGGPVTQAHLLRAVRREYQKMGKVLTAAELEGTADEVAP